jgi:hypothetical protein
MRAVWLDDADLAVGGAEGEQVFAQDLDLAGWPVALRQLFAEQRRHPEAAQKIAHRGALAALRQELVVGLAQHGFERSLGFARDDGETAGAISPSPWPKLAPDRR